jgi:NADPH:quinone reductase-like Zn-dependent oxidoreductase
VLCPDGLLICLPSRAQAEAVQAAAERGLRATGLIVEPDGHALEELAALATSGRLRVLVAEAFGFDRAPEAHRMVEAGRTTGKVVLTP